MTCPCFSQRHLHRLHQRARNPRPRTPLAILLIAQIDRGNGGQRSVQDTARKRHELVGHR